MARIKTRCDQSVTLVSVGWKVVSEHETLLGRGGGEVAAARVDEEDDLPECLS